MLSDMIPHEAIELMVAKIYTESTAERSNSKVGTPPSTVVAGFLSFLHLLLKPHSSLPAMPFIFLEDMVNKTNFSG